ncbi:hypothetical protein PIGHUM_02928 [Pigmentiphaga humi]|uniref:Uncharacterized protein n=1 Tax=Pigmentiphaga humi TaxID=2478468 RepID=A0A3P4B3I9_9BURK|nr:hypothetical protein [Pigmentiphaga humi]VCU70849.1 hypothetical protein PIGHUM_02928 [Pigmentiphaga humi]
MANNLFISYDLMAPGQNYPKVTAAIESLGGWLKVHYSLYYVHTNLSAQQAAEHVWKSMDRNDKLVVIDAKDAYWFNLPDQVTTAIQQHWNR